LQFDSLSIQFNGFDFEINSNGGDEARREAVIRETKQQTRLAHT